VLFEPTATIDTLQGPIDTLLVAGSKQVHELAGNVRLQHWLRR